MSGEIGLILIRYTGKKEGGRGRGGKKIETRIRLKKGGKSKKKSGVFCNILEYPEVSWSILE